MQAPFPRTWSDASGFSALPTADRRTDRALETALSEIGEAVKTLPPDLLARNPGVDWRSWAGLRDIVSHEYVRLEMARLRLTVATELPTLIGVIQRSLPGASDTGEPC